MSAGDLLQAAVVARLRASPRLAALTAVFDAAPARAAAPYAQIDDPVLIDWSTKDWIGREGRLVLLLNDAGERPARLRSLIAAAEDVVLGLATDLGEGWRVANVSFVRGRIARGAGDRWLAMSEFQVRVYRVEP